MELILVLLYVLMASTAPGFLTVDNQLNILRNIAVPGMIAFGMAMVIIVGEIDLSVGSMVAVSACTTAWLVHWISGGDIEPGLGSVALACAGTLIFAALVGLLMGTLRHRLGVPTFISSLAMMAGLVGIANLITNGTPIESFPSWYYIIGSGRLLHVPVPVYLLVLVFALAHGVTRYTTFGRAIYAVGGNIEAARLSGIAVWRTKTLCLMATSMLAAAGGIIYSSLIGSGNPTIAKGMELDVISAVIIGGIALAGGKGTIWGAFVGVLFLGILLNAMTLWGFNPYWQDVVKGSLILGAVLLNFLLERRGR